MGENIAMGQNKESERTTAVSAASAYARRISFSRSEYEGSAAGGLRLMLPKPPRPVERDGGGRETGARSLPRGQGNSCGSPFWFGACVVGSRE
jgi:hypothetical protein